MKEEIKIKTLVTYSSLTNNTKKVAEAIYDAVDTKKDICSISEVPDLSDYDIVAIGYWVDKGNCDNNVKKLLETLHGKKVLLFGTLGASDIGEYYKDVKKRVEEQLAGVNQLLGHFLCQGKIDERLTEHYKKQLKDDPDNPHIKAQLENHKQASSHPDAQDLQNAKDFVKRYIG